MLSAKDLITDRNVIETYTEGRYIVFVLENGIKVKIDPNQSELGDNVKNLIKEKK